ncbi:MAG: hypothetical protein NUV94_03495 [Candidatus Acetothermia bacterium]|jgi:fibronectin type 3 domain-containing protein|nr:hypothetical protein [Candidatus Acetothermia bacterium]
MRAKLRKRLRAMGWAGVFLALGIVLAGCDLLNEVPLPPDQAPTGLRASLAEFEGEIRITWMPVERATAYRVLRGEAHSGPFQVLETTAAVAFTDPVGAENHGRLYWYKVQACNAAGCGPESAAVVGYAGWPPAPTNVQASDGTYADRVVVTWDPVPGADYYKVFRDRNPDVGFPLLADNVTETSFSDATAFVGLKYWYRIKACRTNPGTCSYLSSPDSGCRAPCPPGDALDTVEGI